MNKLALTFVAVVAFAVVSTTADTAEARGFRFHFGGGGVHVDIGNVSHYGHHGRHSRHGGHGWGGSHVWHDTSHWDYIPGRYVWHGDHYDYIPPRRVYHHEGHWDHLHW